MTNDPSWPDHPVIYQIYPRSFRDSTGSGEGDLPGVLRGLDHVAGLGVDAIWLSPFYTSPMCDGGYDVTDHCAVDPRFGDLADFDAVLARAHDLGLKVMVDLVLNHTSDTHDWFTRSRARQDGFEDVYVWADAKPDGSAPSNWMSFFGHPAWRWVPERRQYVLTKFLPCQPCLNHYDDRVGERLARITRFWLDRGVDGFRYDAVTSFFHDPDLTDNPTASADEAARIPGPPSNPFTMQRHDHDVLPYDCAAFSTRLRDMAGEDAFLLGEINEGPRSVEMERAFTGAGKLDAGYTIDLPEHGVSASVIADVLDRLGGEGGFAWWLSSHDQPRHVSALGDGGARDARMFAALICAMPGPLILYQGEELGQPQADLPRDTLRDPFDRMYWPDPPGRDGARAPMCWDSARPDGGFGAARPWLPMVRPEAGGVAQQAGDPASVLSVYTDALRLRRAHGLSTGRAEVLDAPEDAIALRIVTKTGALRVAVNLSHDDWRVDAMPRDPLLMTTAAETGTPGILPPRSAAWWVEPGRSAQG